MAEAQVADRGAMSPKTYARELARLQRELSDVAARTGVTLLFVTHSIQEAVYLGDRVVVLGAAPSTVVEQVDVAHLRDPADPAFATAAGHLRSLLAQGDDSLDDTGFE